MVSVKTINVIIEFEHTKTLEKILVREGRGRVPLPEGKKDLGEREEEAR